MSFPSTTTYLFAGDSLTEGVYGESYVERVAAALYQGWAGLAGQAVNVGQSADTVQSLLDRICVPLQEYQPQWVILAVGGNDIWFPWLARHSVGWWLWLKYRRLRWGQMPVTDLDQFAAAYRALVDRAQQAGARVLACTASPLGERLGYPPNRQLARANGVVKRVAADLRVPVADVWQSFVEELAPLSHPSRRVPTSWSLAWLDHRRVQSIGPDELSERRGLQLTFDGIHLNSRGADLWAKTVLVALLRAQGQTIAPR